ncbi:branched-chain amino acid ABC transporter permease [Pseudonocardia halophobica]|uniref:branched-chain amino acid ABC transporter permease n=1 Tax=Pseudonocardia halophobica TaxID=29401 RepID=UPI003D939026
MVVVLSGIASGAVYGLVGLGIVIVYRATGVVNFASAALAAMGMYVVVSVAGAIGVWAALAVGVAAAVLVGLVVREGVIRPLGPGRPFPALVVAIGVSLVVEDVVGRVWGFQPRPFPELVGGSLPVGSGFLRTQDLLTIAVAAVAMAVVAWVVQRTTLGAAMRAVAESPRTATMLGVDPQRIARLAWAIGVGLAAVGGALAVTATGLTPTILTAVLFRAVAGIFLGGLTSMVGAVVGGLAIGVLDNLAATYVAAGWRDTVVFGVAVLVLLIRPEGLFGKRSLQRV